MLSITEGGSDMAQSAVKIGSKEIAKEFFEILGRLDNLELDEDNANELENLVQKLKQDGVRVSTINNRRYLGNKYGLTGFIRETVEKHCPGVTSVIDIFSGTGAVANAFKHKKIVTNDILYSNYLANVCWFSPQSYRPKTIIQAISCLNRVSTSENNYMRQKFADTYFSADDCSKIGVARELLAKARSKKLVNEREFAILVTSILYGMDRVANTVGHYDAYRRGITLRDALVFPVLLPSIELCADNEIYNCDANKLIKEISGDLLYCDPPYNSRQYSDAYHLLENVARWEKPEVFGIARKMDRTGLKSAYNTVSATEAFRDLITSAKTQYIAISYNNMANNGNGRSNAKISDKDIISILEEKGDVQVFEKSYRSFSAGKSKSRDNAERLFICTVRNRAKPTSATVFSPINYIGGKGKLIPQLKPLLAPTSLFVDLFAGGCTVGANANAKQVIFNDINEQLMELMRFLSQNPSEDTIAAVQQIVGKYGLSDTFHHSYEHYKVNSSSGLASINRQPYLLLREAYNKQPMALRDPLLLYVLVIFGFNNQIRFNSKGDFNLPVGKRDYNMKMRRKLTLFRDRMEEVKCQFETSDFRDFEIESTPKDSLFYCDPPYLITNATYNERGGWSESDERDLLEFLNKVHESGRRFALSNVLEAKGTVNSILKDWIENSNHTAHRLDMSYKNSNYQRSNRASTTIEVLVTNY